MPAISAKYRKFAINLHSRYIPCRLQISGTCKITTFYTDSRFYEPASSAVLTDSRFYEPA
jgi:hypothetical protein